MILSLIRLARRAAVALAMAFIPVAATGIIGIAPAQAQASYPLNSGIVENFIASFPAILAKADELEEQYDVDEGDASNPMEAFGAYMAHQGAMAELNAIVTSHGFAGFADWLQAASSIAIAHAFAREGGQMDVQMAAAIEQIENNPNMTDQQKEAMIAQIEASAGAMSALRPSQENIDAVTPYADELTELFEDS